MSFISCMPRSRPSLLFSTFYNYYFIAINSPFRSFIYSSWAPYWVIIWSIRWSLFPTAELMISDLLSLFCCCLSCMGEIPPVKEPRTWDFVCWNLSFLLSSSKFWGDWFDISIILFDFLMSALSFVTTLYRRGSQFPDTLSLVALASSLSSSITSISFLLLSFSPLIRLAISWDLIFFVFKSLPLIPSPELFPFGTLFLRNIDFLFF